MVFSKGSSSSPASQKCLFTAMRPSWLLRFLRLLARALSLPYMVLTSMKDMAALSCSRLKVPGPHADADCMNGMQVSELSAHCSSGWELKQMSQVMSQKAPWFYFCFCKRVWHR